MNLSGATNFSGLVNIFLELLNGLAGLIIGLAFLFFLIGVVKYIGAGDDSKKVAEARNFIVWGMVGLFSMVSVWGLAQLVKTTFF